MSRLIVCEANGQLGNQLVLFAHLIAISEEFGVPVLNPGFHRYARHFEGSRHGLMPRYPVHSGTVISDAVRRGLFHAINLGARLARRATKHLPNDGLHLETPGHTADFNFDMSQPDVMRAVLGSPLTLLFGWRYRCQPLANRHRKKIFAYLAPFGQARQEAENTIAAARRKHRVLIGMHIRHGDYRDWLGGRYFLELDGYRHALLSLAGQFGDASVGAVICSNEPQEMKLFAPIDCVKGPGGVVSDMHALSLCDYIIGVKSTYSGWAALQGDVPLGIISRDRLTIPLAELKPPEFSEALDSFDTSRVV